MHERHASACGEPGAGIEALCSLARDLQNMRVA